MKEIITAAGEGAFTYLQCWRRDLLLAAVQASAVLQATVKEAYLRKEQRVSSETVRNLKHTRLHDPSEEVGATDASSNNEAYLSLPSEDLKSRCLASFIDRTGNAGTHQVVCLVCASEVFVVSTEEVALSDIPESHLLIPSVRHPAQRLTDGLLLHPSVVTVVDGLPHGHVCSWCLQDLRAHKLPKFALANGLWVGKIPSELAILTLPERLLIGLYFPVSFIVKLYPQKKGSRNWDTSAMNSGLRGNVSTYQLNTADVAAMVEGRLLPHTPDLLPATIGITIIGPQNLPARNLPPFLTVSRNRVKQALIFLKRENSLYSDISISDAHLDLLPVDPVVPPQLLDVVKHSSDTHLLDQEREGYVVEDDDEDDSGDAHGGAFQTHAVMQGDVEVEDHPLAVLDPGIVPLCANGVIDVEASHLSNQDIFAHALSNIGNAVSDSYAVSHGGFVNEYERRDSEGHRSSGSPENPNHLLGAFPHLFPYVLEVGKKAYHDHEQAFAQLTPADLLEASQEESKKQLFSNPTIRSLKHHLSAVRSKVMGTDESRTKVRSYIWGMTMMKNPPSLWITINPTDTHDPVAQVFAGEEIDLDKFDFQAILEELFGIRVDEKRHIIRHEGIFGTVESYIGTVEAQGAPTADTMKQQLQSSAFQAQVADYISSNIRDHHDDVTVDSLSSLPRKKCISYSRPLDPRRPDFAHERQAVESSLVRAVQIHKCGRGCLKVQKGHLLCKRRAPFPLADNAWVNVDGEWGPKRTYAFMNNWNPTILLATRSNHDCKLITNGSETKHISWYISSYAVKRQQHSSNASALLAKTLAYHKQLESHNHDLNQLNKRLLQRCANSLSREQEFSAPEVMCYLMDWEDRYISHHFETIHWSSVMSLLKKTFPMLVQKRPIATLSSEGQPSVIADKSKDEVEYAVLEVHDGVMEPVILVIFIDEVPEVTRHIMSNIQYFHDCSEKAREHAEQGSYVHSTTFAHTELGDNVDECDSVIEAEFPDAELEITEDEILRVSDGVFSTRELVYSEVAMNIAEEHGVFVDDLPDNVLRKPASNARNVDLENYEMWQDHIEKLEACDIGATDNLNGDVGAVQNIDSGANLMNFEEASSVSPIATHPLSSPDCPEYLNEDQRVAFTIVANHLADHLAGKNPPQLLMQLHGQGGTGKTKLIHAITDLSEEAFFILGPPFLQAKVFLIRIHGSRDPL
ncbi:hypothetical protein EV702DRAFT_1050664 [Suillus placidus]|uniref:Helitron helicase-like domain-containing protein n=1 Tax=Suillus placidus TaxID=48579 RepID=A0A9P6ZHI4_9AGAM|nr:hypothetical protein EV702DRAFT_1050664 [Suillus placidus]